MNMKIPLLGKEKGVRICMWKSASCLRRRVQDEVDPGGWG